MVARMARIIHLRMIFNTIKNTLNLSSKLDKIERKEMHKNVQINEGILDIR